MKIAQIAPPWLPIPPENYGGTECIISALTEHQVARGHAVTLFAPADAHTSAHLVSFFPKSLIQEGVPWAAHCKAFYHLQKSIEQVAAQDFDIVHTHLSCSADLYLFPLLASLAVPHVTTLHSCFPFDHADGGWTGDADKYYMDWAAAVPLVGISASAKAQALATFPLNFAGVAHNGIEHNQFYASPQEHGNYFAWIGRFTAEKGAHLCIEAAKAAKVPLIMAGIADEHVQESVDYFREKIEPQIDNDTIKYIGPVNMEQKAHLLSHARGFLNPIQWEEPFGMVMAEAMMSACPVISFDRGAARELIVQGQTGYLVQSLAEMVQAISHIEEIDREATRRHAEHNFSAYKMAEKYVEIYQKVLAMHNLTLDDQGKSGLSSVAI